jgi:2-keto-3-deoxy-6-phosphogluconate aldolase
MAKVRLRSPSPSASTSPAGAAVSTSPNPSSTLVSPARSTAVRLLPTMRRLVAMSVTDAAGPTTLRIRPATWNGGLPPVSTRNAPTASLPVMRA